MKSISGSVIPITGQQIKSDTSEIEHSACPVVILKQAAAKSSYNTLSNNKYTKLTSQKELLYDLSELYEYTLS